MPLNLPKTLREFPVGAIQNPQIVKSIPADGLEELRIDLQTLGNLMICFDVESEATVVVAGETHLLPQRIERNGNILFVEGRNMGAYVRQGPKQKFLIEMHIPVQATVRIAFVAGVVILNGGEGDVTIRGKFGEVAGITHSKNIHIQLRGGDVSLNELSGAADIDVSLGSVTLGWTELRGAERVKVHCGFGGVDLLLPADVTPLEDQSGLFKEKKVTTPSGTDIYARIGFGGLDVLNWGVEQPDKE